MKAAALRRDGYALAVVLCVLFCVATAAADSGGLRRKLQAPSGSTRTPPTAPQVVMIDVAAFHKLWLSNRPTGSTTPNVTFLDVRPKTLFPLSHVPGARSVPYATAKTVAGQFNNKKRRVDPTKDVACYGTDAQTAMVACAQFAKLKAYAKVRVYAMDGGITKWVAAKYPIATGMKS